VNTPLRILCSAGALALAAFAPPQADEQADLVRMLDGKEHRGRVVFEDAERVVLRRGSRELELSRHEVEEVQSLERSQASVLAHALVIPKGSLRDLADMARLCEARGLPGLGALINYKILLLDPEDQGAHERLGHRKRSKQWTAPLDGRWYRWRELLELRRDWNEAWELETTHYRLRCNLPLADAIDATLDLERFYLFFHEALGSPLDLRGAAAPLEVHLHGDEKSYIEIGDGRLGWYDTAARTVKVDGSRGRARKLLLHEATHQLLEVGKNGLIDAGSVVPAWAGEGLAEYLAESLTGDPGEAQFQLGRVSNLNVYAHAHAEEPETLDNLLSLTRSDFLTPKRAELRYAQAYTLVHFCMEGAEGRYRDLFLDYLRKTRGAGLVLELQGLRGRGSRVLRAGLAGPRDPACGRALKRELRRGTVPPCLARSPSCASFSRPIPRPTSRSRRS